MPRYDYQCLDCENTFELRHGFEEQPAPCPHCGSQNLEKRITTVPTIARGIMTHAGDGYRATKEQLRDKWREETPRLRRQLVDKLGEDTVSQMAPSLNSGNDE